MAFRSLFLLLSIVFSFALRVSAENKLPDPLKVQVSLVPEKIKPFQPVKLILQMQLPNEYHAYADQFSLKLDPKSGFQLGEFKLSPLKKWFDKNSNKEREGVVEKGTLEADLIAPKEISDKTLHFEMTYQACGSTFCLFPVTKKLEAVFTPVAMDEMPSSPMGWDLQSMFRKSLSESLWLSFLIAFIAGLLTSLTPCVYPMIPITIAVLGQGSENRKKSEQILFSIIYVLGIATTFSLLGLTAAQFGFLFGSLLSQTWVLVIVCLILLVMALSLFGLFEINPPAFLMNQASKKSSSHLIGAYVSGLFFGVVSSPCVGPVLVAILTWVSTTRKPFLGFALLFTYAIGLGMLFIALGLFSKALPRSGAWMVKVKKLMGLVVLGVSFYYGSLIWQQVSHRNQPQMVDSNLDKSALSWKPLTEQALAEAQKSGKPIMIDFWAVWCAACHELEQNTFTNPEVQKKSQEFILFKYDAGEMTPETKKWMEKFSIRGLPAVIFLSREGVWLEKSTLNEYESPEPFLRRMSEVTSR
jgi:thiol:disulfide interchange protein DsbD